MANSWPCGSGNMDNSRLFRKIRVKHLNPRYNPYDATKPKGRSGHCMSADESNLYVFGGYSPCDERNAIKTNRVLPELWKFNFASQEWIEVHTEGIPTTCASASIIVAHKQVFVFGGTSYPFGQIMSNTIKALNMKRQISRGDNANDRGDTQRKCAWYLLETNPMCYSGGGEVEDTVPPSAYGQSVILHKDALYVFAGAVGFYSEAISDLHKFSFYTMTWEKLTPKGKVPSGRYKQEVASYNDRFYVLGGGRLHYSEGLDKIHVYHIQKNMWTQETTIPDTKHGYPKSRCSFGFAQYKDGVYISGGRHYGGEIEHLSLKDIWHLQLDTMKWTKSSIELPEPLYFHGTVVSPTGHMYIFGGVHPEGFRSPFLYKLRLPFTVPKLSELCWETVSRQCRDNKALQREELVKLGVPWTFIDRVELPLKGKNAA